MTAPRAPAGAASHMSTYCDFPSSFSTEVRAVLGTMDASQCWNDRPGFGVIAVTAKLRSYNIIEFKHYII